MASEEYETFYKKIISKAIYSNQSIQDIRRDFEKLLEDFPPRPDVQFESLTIKHIPATRCFFPEHNKGMILFFHSGAYNAGSTYSHRDLISRISEAGRCPVMSIDYRLAPEDPYPAALEDAILAYRYVLESSYFPSEIILAGSSAGGGLALALMLYLKKKKLPQPAGAICLSPWVDLMMTGKTIQSNEGKDVLHQARLKSSANLYCGDHDKKDPLISPLYGDLSYLPPLFIQVGERELLLDEVRALAGQAQTQGVAVDFEIWPEMFHCWQLFASKIPEGKEAIEKMGTWIQHLLAQSDTNSP